MDWNNNFAESDWSVSPLISIVNMIMGKYEQEILHKLLDDVVFYLFQKVFFNIIQLLWTEITIPATLIDIQVCDLGNVFYLNSISMAR